MQAPAAGSPPGSAGPVPPPGPGPPDKHYAFIEFRSVEEASNAMAFDGVAFKNAYLKVRHGVTGQTRRLAVWASVEGQRTRMGAWLYGS
jgi:hypothetical protein